MREQRLGLPQAPTPSCQTTAAYLAQVKQKTPTKLPLSPAPTWLVNRPYIRKVALIVLMAQSGSWVPARACQLGVVDRIFSRVGASDELAQGNSNLHG